MGGRQSKASTKLSRRFSSRRRRLKRTNPEGESSESDLNERTSGHKVPSSQQTDMKDVPLRVSMPEDTNGGNKSLHQQKVQIPHKWTLTFETNNEQLSHLVTTLKPHIESVQLDQEEGKNIRVRLADNLQDNPAKSFTQHAPTSNRIGSSNGAGSSESSSSSDRTRYYRQIPGMDYSDHPGGSTSSDAGKQCIQLPSQSSSRDHRCHCRRHSRRATTSDKKTRYQSPLDQQSFLNAMMTRLTELQKKSDFHVRLARCDQDESPSDDEESNSEYSGADDNRVVGDLPQKGCFRLFQPLSETATDCVSCGDKDVGTNVSLSIEHHLHDHSSDGGQPISKPWDKPASQAVKKKTFTKKRPNSGLKRSHGYLRASAAIQKEEVTFPNTPKASSKVSLAPTSGGTVQHQHEHIHHHYYYNCRTDT